MGRLHDTGAVNPSTAHTGLLSRFWQAGTDALCQRGSIAVMPDDVELTIVTMRDAAEPAALLGVLSKYVVLTRMEPACRNIDLCAS